MKKITRILTPFVVLSLILNLTPSFASTNDSVNLEWNVKKGDIKSFTLNKWYDITNLDDDDDPYDLPMQFEDINKNLVNVTYKAGLKINIEIINFTKVSDLNISLPTYQFDAPPLEIALTNITFDDSVTLITYEPILLGFWVKQTTDNRSYWENLVKDSDEGYKSSIDGDLFVEEIGSEINKRNWKTGWIEYYYLTGYSSAQDSIVLEMEVSSESYSSITSGFQFFPPYLLFLVIILVLTRKRRQK